MSKALSKVQSAKTAIPLQTMYQTGEGLVATNSHSDSLPIDSDIRQSMIAEAAYLRAEQRGFAPGHEMDDWLAAEQELWTRLADPVTHHAV